MAYSRLVGVAAALCLGACAIEPAAPLDAGVDPDATVADAGTPRDAGPPRAIFAVPSGDPEEPFFDMPWPSDARRTPSGTPDLARFPNPLDVDLVDRYLGAAQARQRGFATAGAIYFRFSHPVEASTLPLRADRSLLRDSSVILVDIDEGARRGERFPVEVTFETRATVYWPGNTLAVRPIAGNPLRGGRRYAAVVRSSVRRSGGGAFMRDRDLEALIGGGGDPALQAIYGPALDVLEGLGVPRADVLSLAVFTTQDPMGELVVYRDWMHASYPAPAADDAMWTRTRDRPSYVEVAGRFGPVPVFQSGVIPYGSSGGAMELGPDGAPQVESDIDLRFALSIPVSTMPEAGYPLVLYSHGTGGDFRSFVADGTAGDLAAVGIAGMGIDQIHHGERNPTTTSPDLLFFNIANPDAARDNNRQSALDIVQQARVVASLAVPRAIFETSDGREVRFDPTRVIFYGHSQGGLVGPLYLAVDDSAVAAVISAGSCGIGFALIEKTAPVSIPDIVRLALRLSGGTTAEAFAREGFTLSHPVVSLVQGWIEASDGCNYGRAILAEPREGFTPTHVLSTEGLRDTYSPPGSIEALATSMRVPLLEPVGRAIVAQEVLGIFPMSRPVMANAGAGRATAGLLQFPDRGHFAVFEDASARAAISGFLSSVVRGAPEIPR